MLSHTKLAVAIVLVCCAAYVHSGHLVGGVGDENPINDEVKKVLASVEHLVKEDRDIKEKFPTGYSEITPLSYRTQVVSGKNYFIKTEITDKNGKKSHAHLRIYHPFRGANELSAVNVNVNENSPLKYF